MNSKMSLGKLIEQAEDKIMLKRQRLEKLQHKVEKEIANCDNYQEIGTALEEYYRDHKYLWRSLFDFFGIVDYYLFKKFSIEGAKNPNEIKENCGKVCLKLCNMLCNSSDKEWNKFLEKHHERKSTGHLLIIYHKIQKIPRNIVDFDSDSLDPFMKNTVLMMTSSSNQEKIARRLRLLE
jgi:hypothetical protein